MPYVGSLNVESCVIFRMFFYVIAKVGSCLENRIDVITIIMFHNSKGG